MGSEGTFDALEGTRRSHAVAITTTIGSASDHGYTQTLSSFDLTVAALAHKAYEAERGPVAFVDYRHRYGVIDKVSAAVTRDSSAPAATTAMRGSSSALALAAGAGMAVTSSFSEGETPMFVTHWAKGSA